MTREAQFKDHFSVQAEDYSIYRPEYPAELYAWLSSLCEEQSLAWDCATGNGQAAVALTNHFSYVIGTDASESQIYRAMIYPRVEYEVALAHQSPLKDHSADLITVAQALHWFDFEAFFQEVKRVAKPNGVLAVWCYEIHHITPEVDAVIQRYYDQIIGQYWPPERRHIEQAYSDIEIPFTAIKSPACKMHKQWTLQHLIGYLGTWSATQKFIQVHQQDPRKEILSDLQQAWGSDASKTVTWPVTIKAFRINPTSQED